jgi:hypothetical protein
VAHDEDFIRAIEDVAHESEPQFEPGEAKVFAQGLKALNQAGISSEFPKSQLFHSPRCDKKLIIGVIMSQLMLF